MRDNSWHRYHESVALTLARTIGIALVAGVVVGWKIGNLNAWPVLSGLVLWFSFGGHWVELWFLNWLRPRLSSARAVQIAARLAVWFVGGVGLGFGIILTIRVFVLTAVRPPAWWVAGVVFVAAELVVHLALFLRRRPNFYSGTA